MRTGGIVAVAVATGLAAGAGITWGALRPAAPPRPAEPSLPSAFPGGRPVGIDAAFVVTGRLAVERMPAEVTGALEVHSAEIVRTAAALETKQARITGTCPQGSAIRVVAEDGTVVCQRLGRGVLSVAALAGIPRSSATATAQGSVEGGVGRYQTAGEDDWLVVPVPLPDGALVTGFSYVFWDAHPEVDGAAYLYRSDDSALAGVATSGAGREIRLAETEQIVNRKVDATAYGYFVYFQLSAAAGADLMPIAASVTYRLP